MRSYYFDVGNSSEGPIGLTARVQAKSRKQAVERLHAALDNANSMHGEFTPFDDCTDDDYKRPGPGIEYIHVFINPEFIGNANIFESEKVEPEDIIKEAT